MNYWNTISCIYSKTWVKFTYKVSMFSSILIAINKIKCIFFFVSFIFTKGIENGLISLDCICHSFATPNANSCWGMHNLWRSGVRIVFPSSCIRYPSFFLYKKEKQCVNGYSYNFNEKTQGKERKGCYLFSLSHLILILFTWCYVYTSDGDLLNSVLLI